MRSRLPARMADDAIEYYTRFAHAHAYSFLVLFAIILVKVI